MFGTLLVASSTLVAAFASPSAAVAVSCGTSMGSGTGRNIVFVLADDLSMNLLPYLPHVLALEQSGTSFSNYTVTDSLCCPSRASIFTGMYPHDTGVFRNAGSDGGVNAFLRRHLDQVSFNVALTRAGYRTALMGKYLNLYSPAGRIDGKPAGVPTGWTEWDVAGFGYREFDYNLNEDGTVVHYGADDSDYLTDVISRRADAFITTCALLHAPFMLEVAPFAPHSPYVPAPRDANEYQSLDLPWTPALNQLPTHSPSWLRRRGPLSAAELDQANTDYRRRVQASLAIDRLLGSIEDTLSLTGLAGNTDIFFSSDNGYHIADYRLPAGKMTAYDTDIRVPLIVSGPDALPNHVSDAVAENIDLAPTFEELTGATPLGQPDGRSLVPLLKNDQVPGWRQAALVEHHHSTPSTAGPDTDGLQGANPPSYEAVRTPRYTYVEYATGEREFYDRSTDPYEMDDAAARLPAGTLRLLHAQLAALARCHGAAQCWRAAAARRIPLPS